MMLKNGYKKFSEQFALESVCVQILCWMCVCVCLYLLDVLNVNTANREKIECVQHTSPHNFFFLHFFVYWKKQRFNNYVINWMIVSDSRSEMTMTTLRLVVKIVTTIRSKWKIMEYIFCVRNGKSRKIASKFKDGDYYW